MSRLIDADELMIKFEAAQKAADQHGREFANCFYDHGGELSTNWYCVEDMVDNAPTVDAVPVVHGRWERHYCEDDGISDGWRCSACSEWYFFDHTTNFCPNCGARMDGRDGDGHGI